MKQEDNDTILSLIKSNTRTSIGRISQKELRPNHLVTALFDTFEVLNKSNPSASIVHNRAKMQELIADNTVPYSGRCRYPSLCEDEFIRALDTHFTLKIKRKSMNKLRKGAMGIVAIILLLTSGCGSNEPKKEDVLQDMSEEILVTIKENKTIEKNIPILQSSSDTLMRLLQLTRDQYTRNVLIKNIQDINESIEKGKATFSDNLFKIEQKKRQMIHLQEKPELVPLVPGDSTVYVLGTDTLQREPINDR